MEFDTWYGPPFNASKLDDPYAVGLTVVGRNKNSLFELENRLDRTEFLWSFRDGVKTFEVEEISSLDYKFDHYYFNRYVHSERDIKRKALRHLDGAVKVYLEQEYSARLNNKLPREPRAHRKIKLFRIDGVIVLEDWVDLISHFFKANEMIIQYLNPVAFEQLFELRIRDFKKWKEAEGGNAG